MPKDINNCIESYWGRKFGRVFAHKMKLWFLEGFTEFLVPQMEESSTLLSDIIRFVILTRLDLTHTCCDIIGITNEYLDIGEIEEIRDEERTTLSELEELATAFEIEYKKLGFSLEVFLQGYWTTKMDEFLRQESALGEEEVKMARQLGVEFKLS